MVLHFPLSRNGSPKCCTIGGHHASAQNESEKHTIPAPDVRGRRRQQNTPNGQPSETRPGSLPNYDGPTGHRRVGRRQVAQLCCSDERYGGYEGGDFRRAPADGRPLSSAADSGEGEVSLALLRRRGIDNAFLWCSACLSWVVIHSYYFH